MRVANVRLIVSFLFLILLSGLLYRQIVKGNYSYYLSNRNCIRVMPAEGSRGRILDINGAVIADNRVSFNVSVIPQEFRRYGGSLGRLSSLLGVLPEKINKTIRKNFVSSFSPVVVDADVDRKSAMLIEENRYLLPGVIVQAVPKRSYPGGALACHIVGYLSEIDYWRLTHLKDYGYKLKDMVGVCGIEEDFDWVLRAKEGGTQIQVDHRGRLNRVLGFRSPEDGLDIRLTIDAAAQKITQDVLSGKKGAAVLMEPSTGRIIAMASSPGFLPQEFLSEENKGYVGGVLTDPETPLINRAISASYPLGSVFKVVSACAALDKNKITPQKKFFCSGRIAIGTRDFNCLEPHGWQDLKDALIHSCNVYFYRLAILLGPDTLSEYALKLGLGRAAGIDLRNEAQGRVPSVFAYRMKFKTWYDGDTANFGIGQGDLLVTPLQSVRLMAALVNGGRFVRPHVIDSIADKKILYPAQAGPHLDKQAVKVVLEALRGAVASQGGTAHVADVEGLSISGKTGTAQVSGKPSHGWFVGFVPFDNPKIVFCVFLENAGSSYYAASAARDIFVRLQKERPELF